VIYHNKFEEVNTLAKVFDVDSKSTNVKYAGKRSRCRRQLSSHFFCSYNKQAIGYLKLPVNECWRLSLVTVTSKVEDNVMVTVNVVANIVTEKMII